MNDILTCSICMESEFVYNYGHTKSLFVTICNHNFHDICIHSWCVKNNSCPVCRKVDIIHLESDNESVNGNLENSSQLLNRILSNNHENFQEITYIINQEIDLRIQELIVNQNNRRWFRYKKWFPNRLFRMFR